MLRTLKSIGSIVSHVPRRLFSSTLATATNEVLKNILVFRKYLKYCTQKQEIYLEMLLL